MKEFNDMSAIGVLIVDDDAGDRKLIRRLLKGSALTVTVTEADAGHAALAIDDPKISAILLDHLLPGETGLDVLSDLRRKWPHAGIVLMTGQGNEEIAKTAIKKGANDYVAKSALSEASLTRMLRSAIEVATIQWKLEEHRKDLETFSDVLIHDLRSPIRGAIFLSEEIIEAIDDGDVEAARDSARLMRKASGQMADFVDSLSKLIQLDHDEAFETCSFGDIADRALTALSREVESSGARIAVTYDLPPLRCRQAQVAQLLQNLVANAIKFSGDTVPRIEISAVAEDIGLKLTVRDHGIGVPPEYRERIFEPFKRVPSASQVAGTGLGLTTCRKIAGRHGGRIWCDPAVVEGTAIHITLPDALAIDSRLD